MCASYSADQLWFGPFTLSGDPVEAKASQDEYFTALAQRIITAATQSTMDDLDDLHHPL